MVPCAFSALKGNFYRSYLLIDNCHETPAQEIFIKYARGLAQACRTLRIEASSIFWGSNQFLFNVQENPEFTQILRFITASSETTISSLRKVAFVPSNRLRMGGGDDPPVVVLIDCEQKRVKAVVEDGYGKGSGWDSDVEGEREEIRLAEALVQTLENEWPQIKDKRFTAGDLVRLAKLMGP